MQPRGLKSQSSSVQYKQRYRGKFTIHDLASQRHETILPCLSCPGFLGLGFLFLAVPFTPTDQRAAIVVELIIAIGLFGAAYSGLMVNYVELSPRFSGLTMAVSNAIASVASAVALPISDALIDIWVSLSGNDVTNCLLSTYGLSITSATALMHMRATKKKDFLSIFLVIFRLKV